MKNSKLTKMFLVMVASVCEAFVATNVFATDDVAAGKYYLRANYAIDANTTWTKTLEIEGVGYRVAKQGKDLVMNLGYSHQVIMPEVDGITVEVPGPNAIVISGADKQKVGQFAAEVREKRPPEPYKGKGIRYVGEYVIRKEGKTGKGK